MVTRDAVQCGARASELVDEDWPAIFSKVSKDQNGKQCTSITSYKELHRAVNCKKLDKNQKAKALWALKEAQDKGIHFLRSGQRVEDPNKIPSEVRCLGNPPEKPNGRSGRRTGTYKGMWTGPAISNERCVMSEVFGSCLLFGLRITWQQSMLEVMSCEYGTTQLLVMRRLRAMPGTVSWKLQTRSSQGQR